MADIDFGAGTDTSSGDTNYAAWLKVQARLVVLETAGALPGFSAMGSITTDGTPQVGEQLTGVDAVAVNLGVNTLSRRWLLGSTVLTTNAPYIPSQAGTFTFQNRILAPGGTVLAISSVDVSVAAATVTPTPTPSPTPSTLAVPTLVRTSVASASTPLFSADLSDISYQAGTGSELQLQLASDYLLTTQTATATAPVNSDNGPFAFDFGGYSKPAIGFGRLRARKSGEDWTAWSAPVKWGSAAVPVPASSLNTSLYSQAKLARVISFAEPVYLDLIGDDHIWLEAVGAQPALSYTLRWVNDGTESYESPHDTNGDRTFTFALSVRGLNQNSASYADSVQVLFLDTVPDSFAFTDVTGATRSTLYVGETGTIAGLASGYDAPITITGNWTRARISSNGGISYGAWFTDTAGKTVRGFTGDAYKVQVEQMSSGSYLIKTSARLVIGGVYDEFDVTTLPDPSAVAATFQDFQSQSIGFGSGTFTKTLVLKAGLNIIEVGSTYGRTTGVVVTGIGAATLAVESGTGEGSHVSIWRVTAPADGSYSTSATAGVYQDAVMSSTFLANASAAPTATAALPDGSPADPVSIGSAVNATPPKLGIAFVSYNGDDYATWSKGTVAKSLNFAGKRWQIAYLTTSDAPTFSRSPASGVSGAVAVWGT